MRRQQKFVVILSILLSVCLVACTVQSSQPVLAVAAPVMAVESAAPPVPKELVILHTNDTHGRVVGSETVVGFSALAALKEQYAQNPERIVLLLDAGDTLHGTPFATLDKGDSIVTLMNKTGYDLMAPGNHDFNYGFDRLRELAARMDFPLLAANVLDKNTLQPALKGMVLLDKKGVKIGVFGLTTPEAAYKTNPKNVEALAFADPVSTAQAAVNLLRQQGAHIVIALAHIGLDKATDVTSEVIAQRVQGIDLIIDGHSHTTLEKGKAVGSTTILSTGEYMEAVGVAIVNLTTKTVNAGLLTASSEQVKAASSSVLDALIEKLTISQEGLLSQVVATSDIHLEGERETARTRETNLGNLLADAMRDATGAAVAFTNGGGIRASIPAGEVTKGQIVTVLPFGNYVVTKEITGQALRQVLEQGVSKAPETSGGFLQVSGLTVCYNPSLPAGQRVGEVLIKGEPLLPEQTYLIATNDFLAAGGDGYDILGEFSTANEYGALDEILADFMARKAADGALHYPPSEGRILASSGIYTVLVNDSLISIALRQYQNVAMWEEIFEANRDIIDDPDVIYAGWQLVLP